MTIWGDCVDLPKADKELNIIFAKPLELQVRTVGAHGPPPRTPLTSKLLGFSSTKQIMKTSSFLHSGVDSVWGDRVVQNP
jgi:hypothetical protein